MRAIYAKLRSLGMILVPQNLPIERVAGTVDKVIKPGTFPPDWQNASISTYELTDNMFALMDENFCCVDLDDQDALNKYQLLLTGGLITEGIGKPSKKGIFRHNDKTREVVNTDRLANTRLDFFSGKPIKHIVLLPCEYNKTIVKPWFNAPDDITVIPDNLTEIILDLYRQHADLKQKQKETTKRRRKGGIDNPLLHHWIEFTKNDKGMFDSDLTNIVGYKSAKDIPIGEGDSVLCSITGLLKDDISISKEFAIEVVNHINACWNADKGGKTPEVLHSSIIKPYILDIPNTQDDGKDGGWYYKPDWEESHGGFIVNSQESGGLMEAFIDNATDDWILIDPKIEKHWICPKWADLSELLRKRTRTTFNVANAQRRKNQYNIVLDPSREFGKFIDDDDRAKYNLYSRSEYVKVMETKELQNRPRPDHFLTLLNNVIPVPEDREFFLKYMSTYLRTLKQPQTNFLFVGTGGSGKSTLIECMCMLLSGYDQVRYHLKSEDAGVFCNRFSGMFRNKFILHIDELRGLSTDPGLRSKYVDRLKSWTTGRNVMLEAKYKDPKLYYNSRFLIMACANQLPYQLEFDDRRTTVFKSHVKFDTTKAFKEYNLDSYTYIYDHILHPRALLDIAAYLGRHYQDELKGDDWSTSRKNSSIEEAKEQAEVLPTVMQLIGSSDFDGLKKLFKNNGIDPNIIFKKYKNQTTLVERPLINLIDKNTIPKDIDPTAWPASEREKHLNLVTEKVKGALKSAGGEFTRTTISGVPGQYIWILDNLKNYENN